MEMERNSYRVLRYFIGYFVFQWGSSIYANKQEHTLALFIYDITYFLHGTQRIIQTVLSDSP
jgi:hypothetical protein